MKGFGPETWGDRLADVYDQVVEKMELDAGPAIEFLAPLAANGRALELAIGGGRVGLPLSERGVEVHGIDASEAMLDKLREQPGSDRIPITVGNFADVGVDGLFELIFVVSNTFFALNEQEEQIRCFKNVAEHLTSDGVFVLEVYIPDSRRFVRDQKIDIFEIAVDRISVDFSVRDPLTQRVDSLDVWIDENGIRLFPSCDRPIPPSELDLMARLAGLQLRERFEDFQRTPFTSESQQHVSVYGR